MASKCLQLNLVLRHTLFLLDQGRHSSPASILQIDTLSENPTSHSVARECDLATEVNLYEPASVLAWWPKTLKLHLLGWAVPKTLLITWLDE